jgi:hypothetical protein
MDIGTPTDGSEPSEPAASDRPAAAVPEGKPLDPGVPIDAIGLLREARTIFATAWPACLVVHWGGLAALWLLLRLLVLVLASFNVIIGDPQVTPALEFVHFVGACLITPWIWLGQYRAFLRIARGQPVTPEDLFRGGPYLLTAVLAGAIVLAACVGPWLIIYRTAEAWLARAGHESMASLLQVVADGTIPGPPGRYETTELVLLTVLAACYGVYLVLMVPLGQFPFLIIDRGAGVLESFRGSWELTRGRVAAVIRIFLMQVAINVAGALACYIGLLVTLPLNGLITALTYRALEGPDLPDGDAEGIS